MQILQRPATEAYSHPQDTMGPQRDSGQMSGSLYHSSNRRVSTVRLLPETDLYLDPYTGRSASSATDAGHFYPTENARSEQVQTLHPLQDNENSGDVRPAVISNARKEGEWDGQETFHLPKPQYASADHFQMPRQGSRYTSYASNEDHPIGQGSLWQVDPSAHPTFLPNSSIRNQTPLTASDAKFTQSYGSPSLGKEITEIDEDDEPVPTLMQSIRGIKMRELLRPKYYLYYIIIIIICASTALITIYHDTIITFLRPISKSVRNMTAGWLIPVVVLFIISFPPLFGHEIVAILCGVVYGLWIGFAIVCAGTFLGEIGNFYAFRYWFKDRMRHYETKSLNYACLAHIVRHGGFTVVIMARLSAIPGHFTTAIFASVGMSIWIFSLAAFLTLPKQLAIVYLGALLNKESPSDGSDPNGDPGTTAQAERVKTIVSDSVLAVSFLITVGAAAYLYLKMRKVRVVVARERRRAAKELALADAEAIASGPIVGNDRDYLVNKDPYDMANDSFENVTPTRSNFKTGRIVSPPRDRPQYDRIPEPLESVNHLLRHTPTYPPNEITPSYHPAVQPSRMTAEQYQRRHAPVRSVDSAAPGARSPRHDMIRLPKAQSRVITPSPYI